MRQTEYPIFRESIHFSTAALPESQYELVKTLDDLTDYRPQRIATYTNLSDAMMALVNLRCIASMIDDDVCQADLYYVQEIEVVNKDLDHYMLTGNRWFAAYDPTRDKER